MLNMLLLINKGNIILFKKKIIKVKMFISKHDAKTTTTTTTKQQVIMLQQYLISIIRGYAQET